MQSVILGRVTDEKAADGKMDALALVRLCLEACRDDRAVDLDACNAIIRNGDPAEIALDIAMMFSTCLMWLESEKRIPVVDDFAAKFLAGLRKQWAPGDAGGVE